MKNEVIILHRKKRPRWEFRWNNIFHGWRHRTKYSNVYCMFQDPNLGKPFWIGRASFDGDLFRWMDVTSEIRSYLIQFPNGGNYYFPKVRF